MSVSVAAKNVAELADYVARYVAAVAKSNQVALSLGLTLKWDSEMIEYDEHAPGRSFLMKRCALSRRNPVPPSGQKAMSALLPIPDICGAKTDVCSGPIADCL